ncbi:MAG: D-hexose-6-phosphate mutarotase [Methylomonas sp.]
MIKIGNGSANSLISVYGGQVLSFQPKDHDEDLLFLSEQSDYADGKAIRGGIPLCWPWFGPDPMGLERPDHGFARNRFWQIAKTEAISDAETRVSLIFNESVEHETIWQQPFTLTLDISVGPSLQLKLTTVNTGDEPFSITQALHSYFRIGHIDGVKVLGLEDCEYFDKLDQGACKSQNGAITVSSEVDRIYTKAAKDLMVVDPVFNRRIHIKSPDISTAVVWNPWSETSRNMPDLYDTAYQQFICVEVGNVASDVIEIPPGGQHSLQADFSLWSD